MKNIITLVALFCTLHAQGQEADSVKFIQRVSCGLITGITASTTFSQNDPPFTAGYGLLANVTAVTPYTYHNVMYGFGNNSVKVLNGYFLPHLWDTYVLYSKNLNTNSHYLGLCIEKMVKAGDVKFFLFCEPGTDFRGTTSLTIGVLASIQGKLYQM